MCLSGNYGSDILDLYEIPPQTYFLVASSERVASPSIQRASFAPKCQTPMQSLFLRLFQISLPPNVTGVTGDPSLFRPHAFFAVGPDPLNKTPSRFSIDSNIAYIGH